VRRLDPSLGCGTSDAACYNFLYEIQGAPSARTPAAPTSGGMQAGVNLAESTV
jgi:hypothetical protein